ncbi:MAG TPA: hypothetical protein DCL54_15440 [Alphaproteobacteria bacterium]|nr:hypothetical protein [Alphaproteobacteria bacterium]HAJ47965.1 hypothetical protein [Alphaproteobacteria bacterium]
MGPRADCINRTGRVAVSPFAANIAKSFGNGWSMGLGLDPATALRKFGQLADDAVPLGEAALALAGFDHPTTDLSPYLTHLQQLADDTRRRLSQPASAEDAASVLAETIAVKHGYFGDTISYDDMQNADLIRVIDRRRGLPVALGILYLETAARAGIGGTGLNMPGHFVVAVGLASDAVVIDPFNGGVLLGPLNHPASSLRGGAPQRVSNRDVLLRLLNNMRTRAHAAKDQARALTIAERMVLIAPQRADLWFEVARASEAAGKLMTAAGAYQACVKLADADNEISREAAIALHAVKRKIN